jgi:hypothetical protein
MAQQQDIDYGGLVERALRSVVQEALAHVATHGVPARHQIYVTFRTDHDGVEIAERLRVRYPTEMTIVLQHEFWDLEVGDDGFAVSLSFDDQPERLEIPWQAVSVFADPGVEFGLQFTVTSGDERPSPVSAVPQAVPASARRTNDASQDEGGDPVVVALDSFRKK